MKDATLNITMHIKGFIFDVDGTLVNSIPLHLKSWRTTLQRYNIILSDEEIYSQFGKTPIQVAQGYLDIGNRSDLDTLAIMQEKTQFFVDHIDEVQIYPGVPEIFEMLSEKKITFVLASNGARATIEKMVQTHEFLSECAGFIAFEDVVNSKPHPEMIYKALNILNLEPNEVYMVGDSIYDIQAGKAAGTYTIAVPAKYEHGDFSNLDPTYNFNNFSEIKKVLAVL